jgi:hypothetical protein
MKKLMPTGTLINQLILDARNSKTIKYLSLFAGYCYLFVRNKRQFACVWQLCSVTFKD